MGIFAACTLLFALIASFFMVGVVNDLHRSSDKHRIKMIIALIISMTALWGVIFYTALMDM
jgi:hypothetical protein